MHIILHSIARYSSQQAFFFLSINSCGWDLLVIAEQNSQIQWYFWIQKANVIGNKNKLIRYKIYETTLNLRGF